MCFSLRWARCIWLSVILYWGECLYVPYKTESWLTVWNCIMFTNGTAQQCLQKNLFQYVHIYCCYIIWRYCHSFRIYIIGWLVHYFGTDWNVSYRLHSFLFPEIWSIKPVKYYFIYLYIHTMKKRDHSLCFNCSLTMRWMNVLKIECSITAYLPLCVIVTFIFSVCSEDVQT